MKSKRRIFYVDKGKPLKMNYTYTLILFLFVQTIAFGQTIKGTLTDYQKEPIIGAQIVELSTNKHTHSDENGFFQLKNIQIGDTLYISHIGYEENQFIVDDLASSVHIKLEEKFISLNEVVISPKKNFLNLITDIDIQTNPVSNSQAILRQVPGLFIGQHAGGGKAEQIFLRGFDIDHGTDISITVDGLPVNMVSHAHGQGYADLHFVIPETVDKIDFGKGLYYADKGNFNTAGYINFKTKRTLDNSLVKLETGQFNTNRILGMFNILNTQKHKAYIASEYVMSDGPFESPQNFNRINLFGKYTGSISNTDKIGVTMSYFTSEWDASGQVPQRAIDDGTITRFGAIDDTEGGKTSRTNFLVNYDKYINDHSFIKNSVFVSKYDFELFSNFTFFLEDPINGDQIKQKEDRTIIGLNSTYNQIFDNQFVEGTWQIGLGLRNDQSQDNELSRTLNRTETLEQIRFGNINETNINIFADARLEFGKWTINPSIRLDGFNFQYTDGLSMLYDKKTNTKQIVSPKLSILYHFNPKIILYLKGGKGFHSNDSRVVTSETGRSILPAAYGVDAGTIWKPTSNILVNMAYWYLFLEQEFVYVGDAGVVEPSGRTNRQGLDLSVRYQPLDWLFLNVDANYTHARSIDEEAGQDFIPLAPDFTFVSGLNARHQSGLYSGLNVRYLKNRPANEDNSIVAEGYTVVDFNVGYEWKKLDFSIQVQNLLNTEWNETQFATESRLFNETESVEEIHFTPGTPFFIKGVVAYSF